MKLKAKILILILTTSLGVFIATIGYVSVLFKKKALNDATKLADSYAREYANLVTADLNVDINMARAMAHSFLGYKTIPHEQRRDIYNEILKNIFVENPGYLAVWTSFELSAYQPGYDKDHGRKRTEVHKYYDRVEVKEDSLNLKGDDPASMYYAIKTKGEETLTNPYFYSYTGNKQDEILEASVAVPIMEDGKFIGLAGMDIGLERFQEITDEIKPFKESYAFFVANNGNLVAHPNQKYINKSLEVVDFKNTIEHNVIENIQKGIDFSFTRTEEDGSKSYVSFAPVQIGNTKTPWAIGIVVPIKVIMEEANNNFITAIVAGIIGLLLMTIVILISSRYITKPLTKITAILKSLAKGDVKHSQKMTVNSKDEIGEIRQSVNTLIDGLLRTAEFAVNIGKGNLEADFELLSENDVLGKSLLEMRQSLKTARQEETKRKEKDRRQNWATEGLAKFAGILRQNNDDIEKLSYAVVSNLVNYMDAIQGAMFILNEEDPENRYFEMTAAYAYHRKKFASKKIEEQEGLIGRCAYEKEPIYLVDIPEEHVNITSGLGDSNPRSLLIVPLKLNEQIFGVIEMASYKQFEKYQIEFAQKVGESIASTISSVKINLRTAQLLKQSQEQAEALSAQEEELRQNMEELEATQEEVARKSREQEAEIEKLNAEKEAQIKELERKELAANAVLNALEHTTYLIEYDFQGKIIYATQFVADLFNTTTDEIIGQQHSSDLRGDKTKDLEAYQQFWADLKSGKTISEENCYEVNGRNIWLSETYTPIFDKEGKPYKVLKIAYDITREKLRETEMKNNVKQKEEEKASQQRTIDKILKRGERTEKRLKKLLQDKDIELKALKKQIAEIKKE